MNTKDLYHKWTAFLGGNNHKDDQNLAILLENCEKFCGEHPAYLEIQSLTIEVWNNLKAKEFVSVQPLTAPSGLVFVMERDSIRDMQRIESYAVTAVTRNLIAEKDPQGMAASLDRYIIYALVNSLKFSRTFENLYNQKLVLHKKTYESLSKEKQDQLVANNQIILNDNMRSVIFSGSKESISLNNFIFSPYVLVLMGQEVDKYYYSRFALYANNPIGYYPW